MLKRLSLFAAELVTNPRAVGAACPSSPFLARRMAYPIEKPAESFVLELGAGTGAITDALLRHGVAEERLVIIEQSAGLANNLRRRYPRANVIEGDAAQVRVLVIDRLGLAPSRISHVVSSLPLRSIPRPAAEVIADGIQEFLHEGCHLVQFTYDLLNGSRGWYRRLQHVSSSRVWLNLPPARVDVYAARAGG